MLDPELIEDMNRKGIDVPLSLSLLEGINAGRLGREPPLEASGLPSADDGAVVDLRGAVSLTADRRALRERLGALGLADAFRALTAGPGNEAGLSREALIDLGYALLPFTAFGVLTGGSATSYVDVKKNRSLDPALFDRFVADFELLSGIARGKPKGMAPAYLDAAGRPGPSYLRLKQRALLLLARETARRGWKAPAGMPLRPFHMPSATNQEILAAHIAEAKDDPLTAGLIDETSLDVSSFLSAPQPMVCAFTHSGEGSPRRVFDRANGKERSALALPGGHGQCFSVLAGVFRELRAEGKRWAYISNVDNLGALPSPLALGVMAATGGKAGFDFSFRTPLDVKGGVLLRGKDGRLSCGDIGAAISADKLASMEADGGTALFNCATGLFDLDWLVPRLEEISERLPLRLSDQDKDAGRYSQAERIAWEVIGLIDDPLIFAVEKSERFLSAKILMETVLMSRAGAGKKKNGAMETVESPAWRAAASVGAGLSRLLAGPYGMDEAE